MTRLDAEQRRSSQATSPASESLQKLCTRLSANFDSLFGADNRSIAASSLPPSLTKIKFFTRLELIIIASPHTTLIPKPWQVRSNVIHHGIRLVQETNTSLMGTYKAGKEKRNGNEEMEKGNGSAICAIVCAVVYPRVPSPCELLHAYSRPPQ